MINIPQPPTDNLYKFAAILGLATLIVSGGAYVAHTEWVSKHYDPARIVIRTAADSMQTALNDLTSGKASREQVASRMHAASAKLETSYPMLDSADAVTQPRAYKGNWAVAGMVVGLVLFLVGLALWYHRLQRYLDAATRAQAQPAHATPPPVSAKKKRGAKT